MADQHRLELHHNLFAVVRAYVEEGGGDGDGWIICESYKQLADEFEAWDKQEQWPFSFRCEDDGVIIFYRDQESIGFIKGRDKLPFWGTGEITVEVYW